MIKSRIQLKRTLVNPLVWMQTHGFLKNDLLDQTKKRRMQELGAKYVSVLEIAGNDARQTLTEGQLIATYMGIKPACIVGFKDKNALEEIDRIGIFSALEKIHLRTDKEGQLVYFVYNPNLIEKVVRDNKDVFETISAGSIQTIIQIVLSNCSKSSDTIFEMAEGLLLGFPRSACEFYVSENRQLTGYASVNIFGFGWVDRVDVPIENIRLMTEIFLSFIETHIPHMLKQRSNEWDLFDLSSQNIWVNLYRAPEL